MPGKTETKEPILDTWGYVKDAGSWDIGIYTTAENRFSTLEVNERMIKYTEGFLQTFGDIAQPTGLFFDLLTLDENGREKEYLEDACRLRNQSHSEAKGRIGFSGLDVISQLKSYLIPPASFLVPKIFVYCDLLLCAKTDTGKIERIIIPEAADYYFGYPAESDSDGHIVPGDICLSFSTVIDIWLGKTYNPRLQKYFDNEELANLNHPLLEIALRNWEKLIAHPIDNVETRYYGDCISRYGFKN